MERESFIMKKWVYAIGDVHGKYDLFKKLVNKFDPLNHQLVLMGDLNDRGPNTKECFLLGMQLVKENNAIYLRGNHEEYFCSSSKVLKTGMSLIYGMVAKKHLTVFYTLGQLKSIRPQRLR